MKRAHRRVHRTAWPAVVLTLAAALVMAYATRANLPGHDFQPVRLALPSGAGP